MQTVTTRGATRLWLELAVLTSLLASFLTIPLAVPHIALGVVWATLAALHVARRRCRRATGRIPKQQLHVRRIDVRSPLLRTQLRPGGLTHG